MAIRKNPNGTTTVWDKNGYAGTIAAPDGHAPTTPDLPTLPTLPVEEDDATSATNPFDVALMKVESVQGDDVPAPPEDTVVDTVKGAASRMDAKEINLRLNRAFYHMLRDYPYYSRIAYSFKRRPTPGLGTVAVDKYWRFYYDPEVIQDWSEEELAGAIAHEVGHCIRGTNERWEQMREDPQKHTLFNICSDALINSDLKESIGNNPGSYCKLKDEFYYLETMQKMGFTATSDMTTEQIFYSSVEKIEEDCTCDDSQEKKEQDGTAGEPCPVHGNPPPQQGEGQPGEGEEGEGQPGQGQPGEGQPGQGEEGEGQPGQGQPGQGQPGQGQPGQGQSQGQGGKYDISDRLGSEKGLGSGDCGSVADGVEREYEEPNGETEGINKRRQERTVDLTADDVIRYSKSSEGRGNVPGGMLRWAEERKHPQVNWKTQLRRIVNKQIQQVGRDGDFDLTNISNSARARRGSNPGGRTVFSPAIVGPTPPSISVIADTSGSMSDEMIAWGLGEMEGILKEAAPDSGVQFLAVDAEAGTPKSISNVKEVKKLMVGGGGTDMRVGISSIMSQPKRKRPQVIILVTDGYTPYPDKPLKGTKLIVALTASGARSQVPDWAKTVMIDPEEAKREAKKRR